jgi:probable rRNA maturation factor
MKVNVLFQSESHYPVNREKVTQAISTALIGKIHRDAEVSVSIVGDRRMKFLNETYRKIPATTDVLSFPLNESNSETTPFVDPPDKVLRLGDIVISYPQAVAEATQENKLVDDVVVFLALHGLNHLMGIHHPE